MSSTVQTDQTPGAIAGRIAESIGEPLRGASLFYALYWLVEIEGIQEAAFDFKQLREEYHDAFWWYGVYTIARELSHINTNYLVDGFQVQDHNRTLVRDVELKDGTFVTERQLSPQRLERHAAELVEQDVESLAGSIFTQAGDFADARPRETHAKQVEVEVMLQEVDLIGGLEEPRRFIRAANGIFSNSGFLEFPDDIADVNRPPSVTPLEWRRLGTIGKARVAELDGWRVGDFNGPGWAGITRHLLRRGDLSETAWVDQGWALAHNNGNWLNKVEHSESELVIADDLAGDVLPVGEGPPGLVIQTLTSLLDANQDGRMERVFDAAVRYNDRVGVNLRRLRRQIGAAP